MEFDSFVTIGRLSDVDNALQVVGIDFSDFEDGEDLNTTNGSWFVLPTEQQGDTIAIDNVDCATATVNGVIIARLTMIGEDSIVNVAALFQGRDQNAVTWQHTNEIFITYDATLDGDCDGNSIADRCDFLTGGDSDDNGILDACEFIDCNGNEINDPDDIADGTSVDCNGNNVPDECDIDNGVADCNDNGVPDSCELGEDCNGNSAPDACDIADGVDEDCDGNGRPDSCDIADGGDANENGELDACEVAPYRNLNSGLISDTAAEAIFAADNGDTIEAEAGFINEEASVNFMGKNLYMNVTEGNLNQGGSVTLANGAVLTGSGGSAVNDVTSGFSGTGVVADSTSVGSSGTVFVRSGAGIEFQTPSTSLSGNTLVLGGGSLVALGDLGNSGSVTMVGTAVVAAGSMSNSAYMSTAGTMITDLSNSGTGEMYCNDETMLSGSLTNEGLVSVNRGPLYILGSLTNNGTIIGDVDQGPGFSGGGDDPVVGDGLRITGDYVAGANTELYMPHANWQLSVGGNVDIAIDNHDRFIMDEATLAMTGHADVQTLEAMSTDVGSSTDGIDRTIDGHFPLGVLVIEAGTDVTVVDNHVNADGNETIYVKKLIIEAGAIFRTGDRVVWYESATVVGAVDGEIDIVRDPCPGDDDENGHVNIDDLLAVIGNFACSGDCDGDVDGNNIVNIDDILTVISNFGPCE
jgi:hypothetical protein